MEIRDRQRQEAWYTHDVRTSRTETIVKLAVEELAKAKKKVSVRSVAAHAKLSKNTVLRYLGK